TTPRCAGGRRPHYDTRPRPLVVVPARQRKPSPHCTHHTRPRSPPCRSTPCAARGSTTFGQVHRPACRDPGYAAHAVAATKPVQIVATIFWDDTSDPRRPHLCAVSWRLGIVCRPPALYFALHR